MCPYAASVNWYAAWLNAMLLGMSPKEAEASANRTDNVKGKGFTRCRINGVTGETLLLSIPIEGGATRLKKESAIPNLMLSDHGNWRHVHPGALNATYGRSPYFQHLMPLLADVYASPEKSLSGFTTLLHEAIITFLLGDPHPPHSTLHPSLSTLRPPAIARGKELAAMIPSEISILDPLMRFGKETLLSLLLKQK